LTEKKIDEEQASTMVPEKSHGHRGRKAGAIYFPRDSLTTALNVSQVIWEKNAGNPFPLLDVAAKVGYSPTSSSFRELIRSANRYGLINESFTQDLTKTISLSPLGTSIVAPTPTDNVNALKRKALETPDLFQKVLTALNGKVLPDINEVKNMLVRNYHLDKADAAACYEVLTQNITELGLSEDIQGKVYLRLDKLGVLGISPTQVSEEEKGELKADEQERPPISPTKTKEKQIAKQIFVAHGKNTKPLEQLEKILNKFKVNYKVAVEEAHSGRPISTKVAELMKNSTSGIFIFTADEKTIDSEGKEVWRPSDNLVYEFD